MPAEMVTNLTADLVEEVLAGMLTVPCIRIYTASRSFAAKLSRLSRDDLPVAGRLV